MDPAEGSSHLEEGLPGQPRFNQNEAPQISKQLSPFQTDRLFSPHYLNLLHVFEGQTRRV